MKKILVVDDDPDILQLIKTYLSGKGYAVRTTNSCNQGLTIFYSFEPDLVLLDINVGTEDGRVMCKSIKRQAQYNHIPVILFSANPELLKVGGDYGADAMMDKPFDLETMMELFEKHL